MNEINSFTIYKEYYELITLLTEKEQQELSLAILKYMFESIEPVLNDRQNKIFLNLKRPLDKSKKRSKAGSNPSDFTNQNENKIKSNENQNENKTKTHQDVNVNVIVNDNVNSLEDREYEGKKPLKADDSSLLLETTKKVLDYLNQKTKSNFRHTSVSTQKKINARLNEGYKLNDFIVVIDKKVSDWNGTEFEQYLCPETLFGTKFEKYLNQKNYKAKKTDLRPNWYGQEIASNEASEEEIRELERKLNHV